MRSDIIIALGLIGLGLLGGCGGSGNTAPMQFTTTGTTTGGPNTVPTNQVPTMVSLAPSCAPEGEQAFNLLLIGQGFVASSVVRWNGSDRPTTFVSSQELTAQISASDVAAAGTAAATVFNPAPGGGSSTAVTFTVVTGGVFPRSIAVDPAGKFAYVANTGCFNAFAGNVSMYTINPTTGALTSIGLMAAGTGPTSVAIDPTSQFVYVANFGPDLASASGNVSMYTINALGTLTPMGTIAAGGNALSVAVHPSGKFAYVADGYPDKVSMYTVNTTTGALTSIGTVAAGSSDSRLGSLTMEIAFDPSGNFAYVVGDGCALDLFGGSVSMYSIKPTTGVLTSLGSPLAAGTCAGSLAVDPAGKFAYVTNSQDNNVSTYSINASGILTSIGTTATGTVPGSIAIHPSGMYAYVANEQDNNVSMYRITSITGVLTSIGTTATGLAPTSIAIHPSGMYAYVTNSGSNSVSMYRIDGATGALALIGTIGT